jgi:uncharacterized protein YbaR (Trm112 family)
MEKSLLYAHYESVIGMPSATTQFSGHSAMDKQLLEILCCPVTKSPVRLLRRDEMDALNRSIEAGSVKTSNGVVVARRVDSALITRDGQMIYRVDDDIPVMLADEAIETKQLNEFPNQVVQV